jgi:hypothetical protein
MERFMAKIKVILTKEDGEVLDVFVVVKAGETEVDLSQEVRDRIEVHYEVEEEWLSEGSDPEVLPAQR